MAINLERVGLRLTGSATVRPARPHLGGDPQRPVVLIEAQGAEIDFVGAALQGRGAQPWLHRGVGVHLRNCRDVVLRNARVHGYLRGILLEDCQDVIVMDCDFSRNHSRRSLSTPERYDQRDFLDIFHYEVWTTYGTGLYLKGCRRCQVLSCRGNEQQNAVVLDGCTDCIVSGNDCSHNSGWGVRLWSSSRNRIVGNNCDRCVSGETEHYSYGNDSAGILLVNACHRNLITGNSLQRSGDGFFLTADLGVERSDHNVICHNDGSHSPHNAFESTFCFGNRFVGNRACHSHYGFWMGFSCRNELVGNVIESNRASGIAIEHGRENRIVGNRIAGNQEGIFLFRRGASDLPSRGYRIEGNDFAGNQVAVRLRETSSVKARANRVGGEGEAVRVEEGCSRLHLRGL